MNLTNLSQAAKLNSVFSFILKDMQTYGSMYISCFVILALSIMCEKQLKPHSHNMKHQPKASTSSGQKQKKSPSTFSKVNPFK